MSLSSQCEGSDGADHWNGPSLLRAAALWGLAALGGLLGFGRAQASAPILFHTPGYESPVRADPDDLLLLPGSGFQASDRVVYQWVKAGTGLSGHPDRIPPQSGPITGTAPIVQTADPPYAIVARMPAQTQAGRVYRLWVVNAAGEWSAPVSINDTRPMWITPPYVYATAKLPGLGRQVRVVGRNLSPGTARSLSIRLSGPRTYDLISSAAGGHMNGAPQGYVAEATLPKQLVAGSYVVSVRRGNEGWTDVPGQKLEVRADPEPPPEFVIGDPQFGECHPDDNVDDSRCFAQAIEAARQAGHGVVVVPKGAWDISVAALPGAGTGFVLPHGIDVRAASGRDSVIVRHGAPGSRPPGALFTLIGSNSIVGITFVDADTYNGMDETRPVIQLGIPGGGGGGPAIVDDIVLSGNSFRHVGRAVIDSGRPLRRVFITGNEFGAYDNALYLTGSGRNTFRIDDSVVRFNRFVPGSFLDLRAGGSGSTATQLGGSRRLDFSSNIADGTSTDGLQDPTDPKGWGAVFFWNISSSHENLLVAENRISCPGDKAGNGEAIAYDDNGNTSGFNGAPTVAAAGPDWVVVAEPLLEEPDNAKVPVDTFYRNHWIQVVQGPGLGQARRITGYKRSQAGTMVTFRVSPRWDILPEAGQTRIGVGNLYWQVYTVGNEIDQASPRCLKANLSGPRGGQIAQWAHTADTVIDGNQLRDTSGIVLQHVYSVTAPSCRECGRTVSMQSAVEVRNNLIDGEYSWSSDCSDSGIAVLFGASATPESAPPVLSFGVTIDHNTIVKADSFNGGAIDVTASWSDGPSPYRWDLVESPLIFHNVIRDVSGPLPAPACHRPMAARIGIRLAPSDHVRNPTLYDNVCERVDTALQDGARNTARICSSSRASLCECSEP